MTFVAHKYLKDNKCCFQFASTLPHKRNISKNFTTHVHVSNSCSYQGTELVSPVSQVLWTDKNSNLIPVRKNATKENETVRTTDSCCFALIPACIRSLQSPIIAIALRTSVDDLISNFLDLATLCFFDRLQWYYVIGNCICFFARTPIVALVPNFPDVRH